MARALGYFVARSSALAAQKPRVFEGDKSLIYRLLKVRDEPAQRPLFLSSSSKCAWSVLFWAGQNCAFAFACASEHRVSRVRHKPPPAQLRSRFGLDDYVGV